MGPFMTLFLVAIFWPMLVLFCAWSIWWCGRTARNAAPQSPKTSDGTECNESPAVAAPYSDPWSCWIPHKEGADREEEINAYISAFIAGLRSAGMDGTSEKPTAFESQRSSPKDD